MEGVLKENIGYRKWNQAVKKYRIKDPLTKGELTQSQRDHDEISIFRSNSLNMDDFEAALEFNSHQHHKANSFQQKGIPNDFI